MSEEVASTSGEARLLIWNGKNIILHSERTRRRLPLRKGGNHTEGKVRRNLRLGEGKSGNPPVQRRN